MTHTVHDLANGDRQRLQALLWSDDAGERALYWRKVGPRRPAFHDDAGASISPGSTLQLDTFLNSFYERYWRDLTGLPSLDFVVTTSGPCRIRVFRRSARLKGVVVAEAIVQGTRLQSVLRISFAELPLADAVLHAEIEALSAPVVVHDGGWDSVATPRHAVRLAIVTCSFGREPMLVENLRRIADVVARTDSVVEFLVVHQGERKLETFAPYTALLSETALANKLRLVQQRNFGGTGGFARGLLEVMSTSATHVLLLDDDIRIEPWIIERLLALLAHLTTPAIIGGQMLDLHAPTMLRASHEHVHLEVLELKNPYTGIDLARADVATLFCRRQLSDYNAWWFCCVPTSTVREIGLPVPMFIRHDDVEYGVRATAAGTPAVTMPGIFVWHEPFTKKAKALTVYYEYRNFLVAAALHERVRRLHFVLRHWRNAYGALKRHRFEYCWALCRAVDDFLVGPACIFVDLADRHRDLMAAQARVTLLTMASVRYHADASRRRRMRWRLSMPAVVLLGQRGLEPAEAAFAATIRALVFATIRSSVAFLWQASRVDRVYRAEIASFTSPASWRHLLGLSGEDS